MSGAARLAFAAILIATAPALAQVQGSISGNVGSAVLRNGYPVAGGAVALPATGSAGAATAATPNTAGAASTAAGTAAGGGAGSGTVAGAAASPPSGRGPSGSTAGTSGAARSSRTGSGGHWVLCPPGGSSGLLPLFAGTDLSCAPD